MNVSIKDKNISLLLHKGTSSVKGYWIPSLISTRYQYYYGLLPLTQQNINHLRTQKKYELRNYKIWKFCFLFFKIESTTFTNWNNCLTIQKHTACISVMIVIWKLIINSYTYALFTCFVNAMHCLFSWFPLHSPQFKNNIYI